MIRKFLICGKQQLYMQNQVLEGFSEIGKVIELALPITEFWEMENKLKEVNYLLSSGESNSEIASCYKTALKFGAAFATKEEDRLWMLNNGG